MSILDVAPGSAWVRRAGLALLLGLGWPGLRGWAQPAPAAPLRLDRHPERLLSLTLPEGSRDGITPPELVPVTGPWRAVATVGGVRTWEAPLPVRLRALTFDEPPTGLAVVEASDPSRTLSHRGEPEDADVSRTWAFGPHTLAVRRKVGQGPPAEGELLVRYPRAATREAALHLVSSGLEREAFVFRSLQVDDLSRHGLYLPAPAEASFQVDVPPDGILTLDARIVPPEVADRPASDGAILRIAAAGEGKGEGSSETQILAEITLRLGEERPIRVDLSEYGGRSVRLILSTDAIAEATGDLVFLAEPTVYAPQERPPRVILVVVDTLRADHLSLYGYSRPTTPVLDAWAEGAAVFEQSRSVSPWTLTSTRTLLLGTVPERWGRVETLQARFAKAGWRTAFLASNTYLSSTFEMERDFGLHRIRDLGRAGRQVDLALDYLARHDDQPVFLVLHLMDQHLPYREPFYWRTHFAGERPAVFAEDSFLQRDVTRMGRLSQEARDYIVARYDNNLAYTDDALSRLWDVLDTEARDTVLITADHGEEFWEHGGFAHGHTVYDEVIRVPLVLAGPGIAPGRYTEPVSGIDVAPTLARVADLPTEGMEGWALQALVDRGRAAAFAARPVAFGRYYGEVGWGVLHQAQKLMIEAGKEQIFSLLSDPGETLPRSPRPLERATLQVALEQALGAPLAVALRVAPVRNVEDTQAELFVPGGIAHAWVGSSPSFRQLATVTVEGERAKMSWRAGKFQDLEIFVVPAGDLRSALSGATLTLLGREGQPVLARRAWSEGSSPPAAQPDGAVLMSAYTDRQGLTLRTTVVPLPYEDLAEGTWQGDELEGALQVLGYVDP